MDGSRSPLLKPEWRQVEAPSLEAFRAPDPALLAAQRCVHDAEVQAGMR